MLYKNLPDTLRSNYHPRQNLGPHADGIVGFANAKHAYLVKGQLKELSLNNFVGGPASSMSSTPTQLVDVHSVQLSTNLNGNQQPRGNKKKGCGNNRKGGKNSNKPKDNVNNENLNNNVGEGKKERQKLKFPYNLCTNNHLTHLCPKLAEAMRLLSIPPIVVTNPFPHNKHMASSSSNNRNAASGIQNTLTQDNDLLCINMVKSEVNVATRSHDYSSSQTIPSLESPPLLETPLHIKN
jgi:hypothetical protein